MKYKNDIHRLCKIILLSALFSLLIYAKSYADDSDFSYKLDSNGFASITSYHGSDSNIIIPSTIDGHEVKSIEDHAFHEERNDTNGQILKNVTISEGITTIGDFAFIRCTNLESVKLPESLTSLGEQTFIGCSKLNSINIPSNLKKIGSYVFQETAFTEFVIPENFEYIGSSAFRSCKQLKSVKVYSKDVEYSTSINSGTSDVFEYCSEDLVLYGYEGSSTEQFAKEQGLTFRVLSDDTSTKVAVTSINLNKTSLSLNVGDSENLVATVLPENATDRTITWSSSDEDVAVVENGKVTATGVGEAIILVQSTDGVVKATCNITVKNIKENDDKNTPTKTSQNSADTTQVPKRILPNTGIQTIIIWLLVITIIGAIIGIYKYNKYKQIR